jgi:hypothetical protein
MRTAKKTPRIAPEVLRAGSLLVTAKAESGLSTFKLKKENRYDDS